MRYRYKYCNQCCHVRIQREKRNPNDVCNTCVYDRKKFHEYSNYSHGGISSSENYEQACQTRCSARSIGELRGH